jgi:hypothetical protein
MQITNFFAAGCAVLLAACSTADNPYAKLADAPLIPAKLHTVSLVTDSPALFERLSRSGYTVLPLPSNYQAAVRVQALLWGVSEAVAGKALTLKGAGDNPDLRVLVMPLEPAAAPADADVLRAFYRNVLGTEVPHWPAQVAKADNVRVQVWTFLIADVLEARRRLREHAIPTLSEPVAITTSYLGDEKTLTLRAPDGAIVELVQTTAQ